MGRGRAVLEEDDGGVGWGCASKRSTPLTTTGCSNAPLGGTGGGIGWYGHSAGVQRSFYEGRGSRGRGVWPRTPTPWGAEFLEVPKQIFGEIVRANMKRKDHQQTTNCHTEF